MSRRRSRLLAVLVAPILAFGLVACGDDDGGGSRGQAINQLSDMMMADAGPEAEMMGVDREVADCIAEAVVDAVGAETVLQAMAAADGDPDAVDPFDDDLDPEVEMALMNSMFECMDFEGMMEGEDFDFDE